MRRLEVFFDYSCPYCLKAHEDLVALMAEHPELDIVWLPTEAHPEPEPGPHSDKMCQALLHAIEQGADIWAFHRQMYGLVFDTRQDYEDIGAISGAASSLLDAAALRAALERGVHRARAQEINRYAYEQSGVWALPAYRMDGKRLDSVEGVGVTRAQLAAFLKR